MNPDWLAGGWVRRHYWLAWRYWKMYSLSQALRIKPDFAGTYNNLGTILQKQGKFEEAIAHLSKAVQIEPEYAEAHNNWGVTLARQAKYAEATTYYYQAIEIRPHYVEVRHNRANALENWQESPFMKVEQWYL